MKKLFFLTLIFGSTCFAETFCQLPTSSKVEILNEILLPANSQRFGMDFRCSFMYPASDKARVLRVGRSFEVKSVEYSRPSGCNAILSDVDGTTSDISLDCLNTTIDELNAGTLYYIKITPAKPENF